MAAPKSHSEIGKMISIAIFFLSFSVSFIITYQLKGRVDFVGILTQLLISVMAAIFIGRTDVFTLPYQFPFK